MFRATTLFCLCWISLVLQVVEGHCKRGNEPPRLALLIGNQSYTEKVGPLRNPLNDVELVSAALKKIGFQVRKLKDASYRQMDIAIRRHVDRVRRAGNGAISFFYYSGHGIANPETKQNYLVPVDVKNADDANIWYESFQQNEIINRLTEQAGEATHYVVFDACRDELKVTGPATKSLGKQKGFVPVAEQSGILIAYATAPGKTASDGGHGSGPYAAALAKEIVMPGVEAVTMFRNVQIRVKRAIGQDPWLSFPALPPVYLAGLQEKPPIAEIAKPVSPSFSQQAELAYWNAVKDSDDPAILRTYLAQFPKGTFAPLARVLAEKLEERSRKKVLADIKAEELRLARQKQVEAQAAKLTAEFRQKLARGEEELKRTQAEAEKARRALEQARKEKAAAQEAAEAARAERARADQEVKVASLREVTDKKSIAADAATSDQSKNRGKELARQLQRELKRVGCLNGSVDGIWGGAKSRSAWAIRE